ncbi:MAG: hypothetical protein M5T61_04215 [Acidimicrobiia bacterium]|nr:hypothetical protein [Acidimicrobiia bacterium]
MRGIRRRWLVIAAIAIALLVVFAVVRRSPDTESAAPASTTSDVPASSTVEPQDQEPRASDIHNVIDFERVVAVASSTTGSRMGMFWFAGNGPDSKMFVGVVEPTAADRESIAAVAGSAADRVVVIPADYSQSDLDGYVGSVSALLGPGDAVGIGFEGEGIDARPVIDVGAESMSPEVRKKIEGIVPADLLRLRVEPGAGFTPL